MGDPLRWLRTGGPPPAVGRASWHSPRMTIRAAVFDVGGVLERVGPPEFMDRWRRRLGVTREDFDAAVEQVDPHGLLQTGGLSEAQMRQRYAGGLALSSTEVDEFIVDLWDWYCGELDEALVHYVRTLRPRLRTAILSNSSDGARREEQCRYGFADLVDDIVYSHEVGLAKPDPAIFALVCQRLGVEPGEVVFVDDVAANVRAAADSGMQAVLHEQTQDTIAAVEQLMRRDP